MTERDLEKLKRTQVPAPSDGAKARALSAAMDAFEEAQAEKTSADADRRLKGNREAGRLTSTGPIGGLGPWRAIMQNRIAIGGAAACLLAVPLTAALYSQYGVPGAGVEGRVEAPTGDRSVAQIDAEKRDAQDAVAPKPKLEDKAKAGAGLVEPQLAPPVASAPAESLAAQPLTREAAPVARGRVGVAAPSFMPAPPPADMRQAEEDRDRFAAKDQNGVKIAATDPVSTFSIDADTASYSWTRRSLMQGRLPSPDAVRIEELINYFPYDYARPERADTPFRPTATVMPTPWNRDTKLIRIGIRGFEAAPAVRPKANLVFLVDVSGSMSSADKLPLVKASLKLLLDQLRPDDSVALVTYAGTSGVAMQPTKASDREAISAAIDSLGAGGSTAGAAGIEEAYRLARKNFDPKGVNRVMIATDGDFNVGTSDDDGLQRLIETERQSGVFLSVLGFGQGNYNDALMQRLAQNGNGTAAYIDQLEEAQKVLSEEATATLFPIAKDVKIQVEFNPAAVSEYRLIGYETRMLAREDFRNDKVDAGEVGSGATVTALYEIVPVGSPARLTEDLRYGAPQAPAAPTAAKADEYAFLKMRYKLPSEDVSRELSQPIGRAQEEASLAAAPDDARFAAAVAAFGQKLKGGKYVSTMGWDEIAALANGAKGEDRWGYRAGFVRLVGLAKALSPR
ncbi:von Willebrand factor type A domain-containing protein [Chelatococcus sambhunathii]|uniref:von Willebrand factor type A domain-containing protein n=2 Tax=Chelatococcus sambhunathii TaxID=363953 RepID=A0ABU1DFL7_9HYPH|nr:von Willebrand factor type A domain-containing protein [Chelatococcus sambhunathii]